MTTANITGNPFIQPASRKVAVRSSPSGLALMSATDVDSCELSYEVLDDVVQMRHEVAGCAGRS